MITVAGDLLGYPLQGIARLTMEDAVRWLTAQTRNVRQKVCRLTTFFAFWRIAEVFGYYHHHRSCP
jgi:hypothetical protein